MTSNDRATTYRRSKRPAIVGAILLLAALVLVFSVTMVRNNERFDEWSAQLLEHPVPPGATLLDSGRRYGLLWGEGNHCDGEAWILLRGDLTHAGLEQHYVNALEESHMTIEPGELDGTWTVTTQGRLGTAGLDLRCH